MVLSSFSHVSEQECFIAAVIAKGKSITASSRLILFGAEQHQLGNTSCLHNKAHRENAQSDCRYALLPERGFQMPSIAHKFSPVDCSVSNAFLCLLVIGAVLKNTNRVFLSWTSGQNARRKDCCKMERGKTPHQSVTSISLEYSLYII